VLKALLEARFRRTERVGCVAGVKGTVEWGRTRWEGRAEREHDSAVERTDSANISARTVIYKPRRSHDS